jgi:hypothetical protein
MIPGSNFFGWQSGANTEAADYALRTGSPAKVNLLQRAFGATDQDAQNINLKRTQERLKQQYGPQLAQYGLMVDWGDTDTSVQRKIYQTAQQQAIGQRDRAEAKAEQTRQRQEQKETRERADALTMNRDTLASNERISGNQLRSQQDQFAFQSNENTAVRAHESSERAKVRSLERQLSNMSGDVQMQMAFIERDIAAKQLEYDRETRRMDKRDAAIAQLMKGIGQLGGAFSL